MHLAVGEHGAPPPPALLAAKSVVVAIVLGRHWTDALDFVFALECELLGGTETLWASGCALLQNALHA